MDDQPLYIHLPDTLSNIQSVLASDPLDDDEFVAHQVEFIQKAFGHASFLRSCGRDTPVSDAFLTAFVQLLEVIEVNAPAEAQYCRTQLSLILQQVLSKPDIV